MQLTIDMSCKQAKLQQRELSSSIENFSPQMQPEASTRWQMWHRTACKGVLRKHVKHWLAAAHRASVLVREVLQSLIAWFGWVQRVEAT